MQETLSEPIHIVGGGLAGTEAAWQIVSSGIPVILHEMRPVQTTNAHHTDNLAELVCSNSFRSDDMARSAIGILHDEMRRAGSLILGAADIHRVPAGGALAVDRNAFSHHIQKFEISLTLLMQSCPADILQIGCFFVPATKSIMRDAVRILLSAPPREESQKSKTKKKTWI